MKRSPMPPRTAPLTRSAIARSRRRIAPVSKKRAAALRQRRKVLDSFGPDPTCERCGRPADDCHELVRRSQGGSISELSNLIPLCRPCHRHVTENPEQAHAEGFHKWSWER